MQNQCDGGFFDLSNGVQNGTLGILGQVDPHTGENQTVLIRWTRKLMAQSGLQYTDKLLEGLRLKSARYLPAFFCGV